MCYIIGDGFVEDTPENALEEGGVGELFLIEFVQAEQDNHYVLVVGIILEGLFF